MQIHSNSDIIFNRKVNRSNINGMSLFCRKATEEMLRKAREDQVKNKEHFLAVQAGRDRAEFERVLK